jgi:uncharacterized membrane protein
VPRNLQRYLVAGVLTLIPLWVTWIALSFLLGQLSSFGRPWVQGLARAVRGFSPAVAEILLHPWFETLLALLLTLLGLFVLGWATTHVIGRRVLRYFERLLDRIPLVQAIYGSVKKLVSAFQMKPGGVQRVVLIDFPSRQMKAVGLVTRTVFDYQTGKELAMVYVPTTPNPTSGYMEIVPVERLTPTDWTVEEAMLFIVSGGTSGPERFAFGETRAPDAEADPGGAAEYARSTEDALGRPVSRP